jgi:hypothetical protein
VQWEQREHRLNDYLGQIPNLPDEQNAHLPNEQNVVDALIQLNVPVDHNQNFVRIEI